MARRKYKKDVDALKPDLAAYNRQRRAAEGVELPQAESSLSIDAASSAGSVSQQRAAEDLYRGANSFAYADHKPSDDAIDRLVGKLNSEYEFCPFWCVMVFNGPFPQHRQEEQTLPSAGRRRWGCHLHQRTSFSVALHIIANGDPSAPVSRRRTNYSTRSCRDTSRRSPPRRGPVSSVGRAFSTRSGPQRHTLTLSTVHYEVCRPACCCRLYCIAIASLTRTESAQPITRTAGSDCSLSELRWLAQGR